jgi:hypothetical protein
VVPHRPSRVHSAIHDAGQPTREIGEVIPVHGSKDIQWIFQGVNFSNFHNKGSVCDMATVSSIIFAGAHKYLQSFRMSAQYLRNVCDV